MNSFVKYSHSIDYTTCMDESSVKLGYKNGYKTNKEDSILENAHMFSSVNYCDENDNDCDKKEVLLKKTIIWMEQNKIPHLNNIFFKFIQNLFDGQDIGIDFKVLDKLNLRPDWLDSDKLIRGQNFAENFYTSICLSETVTLLLILCHDGVLRKLIFTGKSSDSYSSFKRYLSTGRRVRSWFNDNLLDVDSNANKNINIVNKMHSNFYNSIKTIDRNEYNRQTNLPSARSLVCPFVAKDMSKYTSLINTNDLPVDNYPITQSEMLATQFSFVGLVIIYPEKFGICSVKHEEDIECFLHLWRYIGYRLGIKDEHNLCIGTNDEIKLKCKYLIDFIVKPNLKNPSTKWEHMTRCIIEGFQYTVDCFSYEAHLLLSFDMLDLNFNNLYKYCKLKDIIGYKLMKFVFYYLMPFNWFRYIVKKSILDKVDNVVNNMPSQEQFYNKLK